MKLLRNMFMAVILCGVILLAPWLLISLSTQNAIYTDVNLIPAKTYGLLLGTTPGPQENNLFFTTRIEATKELYEQKKIKKILISGDNKNREYNEPLFMKQALIRAGIPEESIILDPAGYRTIHSITRAKNVYNLGDDFIVISQPFHIERAIFLAKIQGIHPLGFGAANISLKRGRSVYMREIGARWLALYESISFYVDLIRKKDPLSK